MTKQVLILNVTRMGDLIQMGPLLARLEHEWPGVAIDLVVDVRFAPVASLLRGLRHIHTYDFHTLVDETRVSAKDLVTQFEELRRWAAPLAAIRYDRIINLTFNKRSGYLAAFVGASDIRGVTIATDGGTVVRNPWMAYFTDLQQHRHLNRFNLVDVYALGGSRPGPFAPLEVHIPPDAREWAKRFLSNANREARRWIAVQIGASEGVKAWRPEYFGRTLAVLDRLLDASCVVIGTPQERPAIMQAQKAYRAGGGKKLLYDASGRTTLPQLAGLLSECRLLLTNDTGPMHVAVAGGTPVLDLSVGHVNFYETGPYGAGHWVIQPDLGCAPCGFDHVCFHHACKDRIIAQQVAHLCRSIVDDTPYSADFTGVRVYRSTVDADELATYALVAGIEDDVSRWYGRFWRRFWYQAFTGQQSRTPSLEDLPPDIDTVLSLLVELHPILDRIVTLADEAAQLCRRLPIPVEKLKTTQAQLAEERARAIALGMQSPAYAPTTTALLRELRNDDLSGLAELSQHHAGAYRQWRNSITRVAKELQRLTAVEQQVKVASGDEAGSVVVSP